MMSLIREVFAASTTIVTRGLEHFLSTGNISNRCSLSSVQSGGWVIMAERINIIRYLAHFRSLHRGTVLMNTRSSGVRRLCPESFGFVCPVNTPDGTLCGILTHLSAHCAVSRPSSNLTEFISLLVVYGMIPEEEFNCSCRLLEYYEVILDGCVVGRICQIEAKNMILFLREQKTVGHPNVPKYLEIAFVEVCEDGETSLYPGIYMFTMESRLIRPVFNIAARGIEYISTMEQVYLGIAPNVKYFIEGFTTHYELIPYSFMSFVAAMTPFSEFNQSPRNMYQCQMGKQSVGTPCHFIKGRYENKLYQLAIGQSPLVKTRAHQFYEMDQYPFGINAVVAVLSYTGYDMEDAMILNKMSVDRGFGKTLIYTAEVLDISDGRNAKQTSYFSRKSNEPKIAQFIDSDGLPFVGMQYNKSDPFYSYTRADTNEFVIRRYNHDEPGTVVQISIIASESGHVGATKVCVLIEKCRDPIIGDKFSSRHGQKGVCSKLYPTIDLPFNEHGIVPDIIFNPHGFPSRMTIGMMLEFLTGKSAAILGSTVDSTPFQFDSNCADGDSAIETFGEMLRKCGFSHHGTEIMYSGVTGEPLKTSVFMGMVFYQRLRHMVSDKFQVRRVGHYDAITRQPVKGRKRGGGIRVGEMERDAILAHGCSFSLIDRLLTCSDRCVVTICSRCGIIGTVKSVDGCLCCVHCNKSDSLSRIVVPYILTYLVAELSAVNIAMVFKLEPTQNIDLKFITM